MFLKISRQQQKPNSTFYTPIYVYLAEKKAIQQQKIAMNK